MSRRKPLAALAALTAAVAVAAPTASASAVPVAPALPRAPILFGPGSLYCNIVYRELRFADATRNIPAANFLGNVFVYSGCGGAAI
jgi:hypothetical protein